MSISTLNIDMVFNVALPLTAIIMFVLGSLYKLYKYNKIIKTMNKSKDDIIHKSYRNSLLLNAHGYLSSYPSLDPDREMESLAKNWVIHLYSRTNANIIYARILDCIDTHRFMMKSIRVDESLFSSKYFNDNYMQNVQLFFFLIDILQLPNKERKEKFEIFKSDPNYLYDLYDGYFKEFTTLSYKPKT